MKVAQNVSIQKIVQTNNFSTKTYPSIIPKLRKDDVSSVVSSDELTEIKKVYQELKEFKQYYLDVLSMNAEENEELTKSYGKLIYNVLAIERKLISIHKRRCHQKLKSKDVFRDVDKKLVIIEKLTHEVEKFRQEIYLSEQLWNSYIKQLNKKEKKKILILSQNNNEKIDQLFDGISSKWQIYKKVHNAMDYVDKHVTLKGRKRVTLDVLKDIIKMQNGSDEDELFVS